MRNLILSFTNEALHIRFGLRHSQANVTPKITTSGFSFDAHKIRNPNLQREVVASGTKITDTLWLRIVYKYE